MAKNWQEVPRDPIADDDELERLYQVAELKTSAPVAAAAKFISENVPPRLQAKEKKTPTLSHHDSTLRKLAS
jgi:hypothetical protein